MQELTSGQEGPRLLEIAELTRRLSESRGYEETLEIALETLMRLFAAEAGALVLQRPNGQLEAREKNVESSYREELLSSFLKTSERAKEVGPETLYANDGDLYSGSDTDNVLRLPIARNGSLIGFFEAHYSGTRSIDDRVADRAYQMAISNVVALAVSGERRQSEVVKLKDQLEQRVSERTDHLRSALNELETFSYSVSHDLRAPLRSIDGFASILETEYSDRLDAEGKHYLTRIVAASRRLNTLIESMLDLSSVAQQPMQKGPVDLSELSREVVDELRSNHSDRNVEITIDEGIVVDGDQVLLRSALENLLSNAWKFTATRDPAVISVTCSRSEDHIDVSVTDNGVGFDPDLAQDLFVPFQRLHSESEYPGSGIGLATVARILKRHGGSIAATSTPERGSTFTMKLPNTTE